MNTQEIKNRIKVSTIISELSLNKTTVYKDIKFLNIETAKDEDNETSITNEDYQRILNLRKHIELTGTRNGFEEEKEGQLIVRDNTNISQQNEELEEIYVDAPEPPQDNYEDDFMRSAFELKAREIAMPDLVKRALADEIQEEDLPQDLKDKVNNARESANPKFSPSQVATTLLRSYREKLSG